VARRDPARLGAGMGGRQLLKASWMASSGVFASASLFPLLFKILNYFVMEKNYGL
jgi:hypothetical protein